MGIGTIQFTTISRTQELTTIKQQEDNKAAMDQVNSSQQMQKQTRQLSQEVNSSENSDWYNKQPDAKEKGNNEYAGDGGKNRKKQQPQEKMVVKKPGGFDIKI
ncbi:MAG: hypothetical protein II994_04295 [Lachnospiraceae bacterium]|nr:hypothetical protein [Lachnospiraceae bacterium]